MSDYSTLNAYADPQQAIVRDIVINSAGRLTWAEAEQIAAEQAAKRAALKAESNERSLALFGPEAPQPPDPEQVRGFYRWQFENGI